MRTQRIRKPHFEKDDELKQGLSVLVLPIAFQQFMLALVSATDAAMLGALNQDSMSAVSLAGQFTFVENLFLAALNVGCNMFAAQYWGKGDKKALSGILGFSLRISGMISLVLSLMAGFAPGAIMGFLTNESVLIEYGSEYLRAVSLSYFLTGISQMYLCVMKNSGRARLSTLVSTVSVLMNIAVNAVLIFGLLGFPALGIRGAAYATVLSRAVEVSWVILASFGQNGIRTSRTALLKGIPGFRKTFWKYTGQFLFTELAWGTGFSMYSVIMGHMGTDAVAANSIANIVKNLLVCFCTGFAAGGSILIGNELGRGDLTKAKGDGEHLLRASVLAGIATGLVILVIAPFILRFANLTDGARFYLKWMLVISSYYVIGKSINMMTIAGIFPAGGDSRFGMFSDSISLWVVTVPLGALAAFRWNLPVLAVYFILNLDEIIKLPFVFHHYHKYKWLKNLTQEGGNFS